MPFRNRITGADGVVILPQLQSPDYARTDTPFAIQGWRLSNDPSEINVGSLHSEQLFISSDVPGSPNAKEINVTQFLGSGPDHEYWKPINPLNLGTTYSAYSKLTESYARISVPPMCVGADSPAMCHWMIHTSFDVRSTAATLHNVRCTIALSYTGLDPWTFPWTSDGTIGAVTHNYSGAIDTVNTLHVIGSENNTQIESPSYTIPPGTTAINISPAARASVASVANINLASTYIHIVRSPLYARLT